MPVREKLLIFLIFFLIFSFFSSFKTEVQIPDEEYVLRVAQNIAESKPLNLPEGFPYTHKGVTEKGRDGKNYSTYPIGQSLIFAPFYYLSKKMNVFLSPYDGDGSIESLRNWANGIEFETTRYLYVVPALFSALTCLIFFMFCFRLGHNRKICILTTSILAFCTMIWPYSKFLLSEATQTFFLISTFYMVFLLKEENDRIFFAILAGIAFGFLNIIKPTFLIIALPLAAYWFYGNREMKRGLVLAVIFIVAFMLVFWTQIAYNIIRMGEGSNFGYTKGGFSSPFYAGLYGFLFSSGKSFFLYSPVALLFFFSIRSFFKKKRELSLLFASTIIIMILVYSSWGVWSGDLCWGPRFLVPLIPLFMMPTAGLFEKMLKAQKRMQIALVSLLVLLSLLVQVPAVAVHYLHYLNYFKTYVSPIPPPNMTINFKGRIGKMPLRDSYIDFQFIPEFSPVLGQWWVFKNLLFRNKEAFLDTPWKKLGLNVIHQKIPLRAKFDLWTIELVDRSLTRGNFSNLFYLITMLLLIPLVIVFYFFDMKYNLARERPYPKSLQEPRNIDEKFEE